MKINGVVGRYLDYYYRVKLLCSAILLSSIFYFVGSLYIENTVFCYCRGQGKEEEENSKGFRFRTACVVVALEIESLANTNSSFTDMPSKAIPHFATEYKHDTLNIFFGYKCKNERNQNKKKKRN